MKERDRIGFQQRVQEARRAGKTLTEAIEMAYSWLLLPGWKAHGE